MMIKRYIWALIVCVLAIVICQYGHSQYQNGYAAAQAKISQDLAKMVQQQQAQWQTASFNYQQNKAESNKLERESYVHMATISASGIYQHDCFDDDGMQELNQAIQRANAKR